jgi:light-regulated signal transduction histidine kinase (bacteriophytochrome)
MKKNLNSKAFALFIRMINFFNLSLNDNIPELFMQALKEVWPDQSIMLHPSKSGKAKDYIAIASAKKNYGYLEVKNLDRLDNDDVALIQKSVDLLVIILNKLEQQKLLDDEKVKILKESEESIRKLNESLEQKINERTTQLEASIQELEAFSYSVSHDLRAPVRHINGFAGLMKEHYYNLLPEKGKHYLDVIAESTHHMGIMIDDLLQFSRSGKSELDLAEVDMNLVFREAMSNISKEIHNPDVKWINAPLPVIWGDYNLLCLVWINLLSNAIKFTGKKKNPVIETGCRELDNEYEFFIRDNGAGFDLKHAHKLFGVFQRLHSFRDFEGNGIGLANVRRIITKHGGRTWAEGQVNKGAIFYFSLPITKLNDF